MRTLADAYIVTKAISTRKPRYFVRFFLNLAFAVSVSHERGRRFESSLSTIGTPALRKALRVFRGCGLRSDLPQVRQPYHNWVRAHQKSGQPSARRASPYG